MTDALTTAIALASLTDATGPAFGAVTRERLAEQGVHLFSVDSLAAAMMVLDIDWNQEPPTLDAAAIIQAAKEAERES